MARRVSSKNELIKCEYCGEMYAASYKHCPFCNEDGTGRWDVPDEEYEDAPQGGGKRLAGGGKKSGGRRQGPSVRRVISMVVSLALIIAAAGIVISIMKSLFGDKKDPAASNPTPTPPAAASTAPSVAPSAPAVVDPSPAVPAVPSPAAPQTSVQPIPSVDLVAPTSFKLNRDDFTFDHAGETFQMKVTYTPADARGDVTWKSSDPNVASVSWNGVVTAISQGTVTLTASVAGAGEKTCIVRCNFKDTSTPATTIQAPVASTAPSSSSSGLKLNRDDFTLSREGETWRLTVSGSSSAVTWTSSKPEVATVSADGTVTAVSKGTCSVTAEVDGVKLKCIVRCNF